MRKSEPISFRMPLDEYELYTRMAKTLNMSMTDFILEAIRDTYSKQSQRDRYFADGTPDEVWYGHG